MLKATKMFAVVLGVGCSMLTSTATPASAAPKSRPVVEEVRDVTWVHLMQRGRAAKVAITVVCPPAASRLLTVVAVAQYGTPTSGPAGTFYESTKSIGSIGCTGKPQRFNVVVTPQRGSTGRLARGEAAVTIGGYDGPHPSVSNQDVLIT